MRGIHRRGSLYLGFCGCMAAGIILGRYLGGAALLTALSIPAVCAACLALSLRSWAKTCVLAFVFLMLGAALMYVSASGIRNGVLRRLSCRDAVARVGGRVISPPMAYGERTAFFLEVSDLQSGGAHYRLRERVLLEVDKDIGEDRVFPGLRIRAYGSLASSRTGDEWLFDHGAACILRVSAHGLKAGGGPSDPVSGFMHHARTWMSGMCGRMYTRRVAGFVEAVTLSKLDDLDGKVLSDLRSCGLGHVVAISGLHVGSAAMIALALMAAAGAGRRGRYVAAWAMALFVLVVSSFRPSALRACMMAAVSFTGILAGREYDSLVGLDLACILILCANPRALFDAGFQYSFAAALGLVLAIRARRRRKGKSGLRSLIAVTAGAQLGIIPVMFLKGESIPVTAVAANLLVVPLVGFLLMTGWGAGVVCLISTAVGRAAAVPVSTIARFIMAVASTMSDVPRSGLPGGTLPVLALVIYLIALFGFIRAEGRGTSVFKPLVAATTAVALMIVPFACPALSSANRLTVLDVGEGDAALIQDRTGAAVLVDGGPDGENLIEKLQARGVRKLDLVVLSHRHSDHLEGLLHVFREIPVGCLLDSRLTVDSGAYAELTRLAGDQKVPHTYAREGQMIEVSPLTELEVVHTPEADESFGENLNDSCVVLMARVAGMRVLMTGDIGAEEQRDIVADHPGLRCDVLKVSHHGAQEAACDQLYSTCAPAVAAISVGKDNKFGHPSKLCLDLLSRRRIDTVRTDRDGDVVISVDNGRIGLVKSRR